MLIITLRYFRLYYHSDYTVPNIYNTNILKVTVFLQTCLVCIVIAALKIIYFREPIKEQRMRASMNMYEGRRVDTVEST